MNNRVCKPKMDRRRKDPPSFSKPRPYSDSYNNTPHEEAYEPRPRSQEAYQPHPRSQRGFRGHEGRGPPGWRDARGRGRPPHLDKRPPHLDKRPPLMGERRERPFNQRAPQNQDSFHSHPSQTEPHHGHRRPPAARPNRPPPAQHPHRSSPHTSPATHGSPGQRAAPYHGHHGGHRSPSPAHYHGQAPPDRRPTSTPPPPGPFRGPHVRPSPSRNEERSWGPPGHPSPRERQLERGRGRGGRGGRWNGRGRGFSHPHIGERGPPGFPPRKPPRLFHERGSYPERYRSEAAVWAGWPAERDPRKQQQQQQQRGGGEVGREGGGRHSAEWKAQEGGSRHRPPYRAPAWKGGPPSSFYHGGPQERPGGPPPRKRKFPDCEMPPPSDPDLEHGHPKHPRRGDASAAAAAAPPPSVFSAPRGFGGRPLSLRDKSRILKGRKMRAESVLRVRAPPVRPRGAGGANAKLQQEEEGQRAAAAAAREDARATILAQRRERFQTKAGSQSEDAAPRRPPAQRRSPSDKDATASSSSSRDSETVKERSGSRRSESRRSESRRSVSTHSPSPIDRRLTRDLVVVSQWHAAPNTTSSKDDSSPRERTSKTKTERYFNPDGPITLNERFSKMHDSSTSPRDQRGRYPDTKTQRLMDMPEQNHRGRARGRPFHRPGPLQRPNFHPGTAYFKPAQRGPAPEHPGPFRKPLMGGFVPRPFAQRPALRKSQGIMSKYRNLQTTRQRAPYSNNNNEYDNNNNNNHNNNNSRGSHYRRW